MKLGTLLMAVLFLPLPALIAIAGAVEASASGPPAIGERDRKANPFTTTADPFAALAMRIQASGTRVLQPCHG